MADFLLFLGKLNLAMGAAIVVVYLLRRPLRELFGAPIAYAIWLLVPIAGFASLLPPRVAAPPPVHLTPVQYPAAPMSVIRQFAHPALRITEQLTGPNALVHPLIAARAAASVYGTPDYAALLFAAWALGTVLMALYLARLQIRFHATMRLGEAGPAVLGFFRPRLVIPDSFQEQFTAAEQAAILAHERVHLSRQDARINALAALLRCLCWFNPLIHLGAASMRIDQELACDATALTGPVSRRDYANALLKSQMMVTALPLGCNWPGSQHPLLERIALLKRKRPGTARRIAGTGLVMVAAISAGLSAWAAQPPVPAKFIAGSHQNNQVALATPPVVTPAPSPNAGEPVADAKPNSSKPISVAPPTADAQTPNTGSAGTQSALRAIQVPDQKIDLALNEATGAALAKDAADASSALSDRTVAQQMAATGTTTAPAASAPAEAAQIGSAPRPQTEAALKCLNGLGPDGCETLFKNSSLARRAIRYCAAEYVRDRLGNCAVGPLEALEYLGANAAGDDVYSAKTQSETDTTIIPPPGPDGKIARWCGSGRPPESTFRPNCSDGHSTDSSIVKLTARPDHAIILYTRPQVHAALQSTSQDSAFIPAAAQLSNPVSPTEALSRGTCVPTIGTVISVHRDSSSFGTDVVLDHVSTSPQTNPWMRDNGTIIARIPADNVKSFSALDIYVGRKVALWPIIGDFGNKTVLPIVMPGQLQLLSTALADPKKTWCYFTPMQRNFP
jgi:beta-lactamase regulating signal transducer with metallopeptidase domain